MRKVFLFAGVSLIVVGLMSIINQWPGGIALTGIGVAFTLSTFFIKKKPKA